MNKTFRFRHCPLVAVVLLSGIFAFQWSGVRSLRATPPSPARSDDATSPVPRYRLQVGQELKYQGTGEFKHEKGSLGSESDWQVWVIHANNDGSWRLLFRESMRGTQSFGGRKFDDEFPNLNIFYCDLFPDGRIVPNDSLPSEGRGASYLFPRLPKDAEEASKGWQESNEAQGTRTEFKSSSDQNTDGTRWTFEGDRQSDINRIALATRRVRYAFDVKQGFVKRVETKGTQDYKFHGKGTETEELTSVEEQDINRVTTLSEDFERYFEANRVYQDLLNNADQQTQGVEVLLSRAETILKDVRVKLTTPDFCEYLDYLIKYHAQLASYYAKQAKNKAEVVGKEAADWEAKDLEGNTHSLKGYRGKVVILDFWYRGCGPCLRAMPQIKRV